MSVPETPAPSEDPQHSQSAADLLRRRCTECPRWLRKAARPNQLTCSGRCRTKRSRRLQRLAKERDLEDRGITPEDGIATKVLKDITPSRHNPKAVHDILAPVMQDELRPIVRESITEDTLRAIQGLVALTPLLVEQLGSDMAHPDPSVRSRACAVVARYTLGHQAIVQAPEQTAPQMTVVFDGMPRSADVNAPPAPLEPAQDGDVVDADQRRTCDICGQPRDEAEFVEHSERCLECHKQLQARVAHLQ